MENTGIQLLIALIAVLIVIFGGLYLIQAYEQQNADEVPLSVTEND